MTQTSECFECAQPASHDHHVVPRSMGGTKTIPLCDHCHGLVHGISFNDGVISHSALTSNAMQRQSVRGFAVGTPPLGYAIGDDGKLKMVAHEQHTIELIHELADEGLSVRKIAAKLNEWGALCRGKRWHKTTVHRILSEHRLKPQQCELIQETT